MNTETPFYILSAASSECDDAENTSRHEMLSRQLRSNGLAVADCDGCYKGELERALLVLDETPGEARTHDIVRRLAHCWGQESFLAVDANRATRLAYVSGGYYPLGVFTPVRHEYAKHCDWTRRAGQYYVCVKAGAMLAI